MKVIDILGKVHTKTAIEPLLDSQIELMRSSCSQFLIESDGRQLIKNVGKSQTFIKIKARQKKNCDSFSEAFNAALSESPNLRQRAIFAHGQTGYTVTESSYFIFPINNYKYVYNPSISNSSLLESVHLTVNNTDLFEDLVRHQYTNANLAEGIDSGAEILLYGTPYCYAVNTATYPEYKDLIKLLK